MPPELDRYLADAVRTWEVPGLAVAIVKDDRVVAAKGYGVRELGRSEPVDGRTIFDIASLTKSFTAAGAAVLVDEGRLGWDDRVRDRLPAVAFEDAYLDHEVTLRDLLCHRTGLQHANAMIRFTGVERSEVLRRVRFLKPQVPFRTSMVYSNVLYTVAGEMTAAAAGTSWADLIRTRLIEPAGMRSTTVEMMPAGPNVARPHALIDDVQRPIRPFDWAMVGPSSSIYSCAEDMARWLRLQLGAGTLEGRTIIRPESVATMHAPQAIIATTPEMRAARLVEHYAAYGLGWQVMDYRGEPLVWHTGGADGMPSYMGILPRQKLGVVVMMNTWGADHLHGALANRIIDTFLGAPARDWSGEALVRHKAAIREEAARRPSFEARRENPVAAARPLEDYAATYTSPLYGDVHVGIEEGALSLRLGDGAKAALTPWDGNAFLVTWRDPVFREVFYDTLATFGEGSGGVIDRFTMVVNRETIEATRPSATRSR
jgi:CubicO group peptidase (beta-lactamase class C family)